MGGKTSYRVFIAHPLTYLVVHKETRIVYNFIIYDSSKESVKYLASIWSYRKENLILNDPTIQLAGRLLSEAHRMVTQSAILLSQSELKNVKSC